MPFGLINEPTTFQALMNHVFKAFFHKFILVFFDNILVYSSNEQEHYKQLEEVFKLLKVHKLYAKQCKYWFVQTEVEFLGHIISQ